MSKRNEVPSHCEKEASVTSARGNRAALIAMPTNSLLWFESCSRLSRDKLSGCSTYFNFTSSLPLARTQILDCVWALTNLYPASASVQYLNTCVCVCVHVLFIFFQCTTCLWRLAGGKRYRLMSAQRVSTAEQPSRSSRCLHWDPWTWRVERSTTPPRCDSCFAQHSLKFLLLPLIN